MTKSSARKPAAPVADLFKDAAHALTAEAASEPCLPDQPSSATLSSVLGLPVLIFYADELPFAFEKPEQIKKFSGHEIKLRKKWLLAETERRLEEARLSDAHKKAHISLKQWQKITSQAARANDAHALMYWKGLPAGSKHLGQFHLRLPGDTLTVKAMIVVSDRRWSAKQDWAWMTFLPSQQLEHWPAGNAFKYYIFMHETGHLLQRDLKKSDPRQTWLRERDADLFAFEQMEKRAQKSATAAEASEWRQTIDAVKKARALGMLVSSARAYWFAGSLAYQDASGAAVSPDYKDCVAATHEVQFRSWCQLHKHAIAADSKQLQKLLSQYKRADFPGDPKLKQLMLDWSKSRLASDCDPAFLLPALRKVMAGKKMDDPLARHIGQLIIDAAQSFCPGLLSETNSSHSKSVRCAYRIRRSTDFTAPHP